MRTPPVVLSFLLAACSSTAVVVNAPPPAAPVAPSGPTSPEVLVPASVDFDIACLFADTDLVYWAHRGEKGLVKVPLTGGPPMTLVPGGDEPVTSCALDAKSVYFTTGRRVDTESSDTLLGRRSPRAGHFEGVVARVRKDGTSKPEDVASGRFRPEDVALDAMNLYWIMSKKDAILVRQPIGQVDAQAVVAHGNFLPGSLTVSGGFAYWIDPAAGPAVMRVSTNGGEPTKLGVSPTGPAALHPAHLAADDVAVYVTDTGAIEGKGSIVRIPVAGSPISLLAENLDTPRAVVVRGGTVYWLNKGTSVKNFQDGSLEKVPATGGAKVTMATGLVAPDRLAVSDARVVWSEVSGTIKDMGR